MNLSSINQGSLVEVKTKQDSYKGTIIQLKKETIVIKLDNGYNIGIYKKNIKDIKIIKKEA